MKRSVVWVAALALVGMFAACGTGDGDGTTQVAVQRVRNNPEPGGAVRPQMIPSEITSIVIEVYGPGMESITDTIPVTSDMWELPYLERYYDVPNGPDRHVSVSAYGTGEPPGIIYCGFEAMDLSGGAAVFEILMGSSC